MDYATLQQLARTAVAEYVAQKFPAPLPGPGYAKYYARCAGVPHGKLATFYAAMRTAVAAEAAR